MRVGIPLPKDLSALRTPPECEPKHIRMSGEKFFKNECCVNTQTGDEESSGKHDNVVRMTSFNPKINA
jgi:hypothetical protein